MIGGLEGLPSWLVSWAIGANGINGLLMVLFWVVISKNERYRREDTNHMRQVMDEHRKFMESQAKMYADNVSLVRDFSSLCHNYEKLASDLTNIIHLNTQVQTRLVERIDANRFCPVVKDHGVMR
jgi:hypothetical protein